MSVSKGVFFFFSFLNHRSWNNHQLNLIPKCCIYQHIQVGSQRFRHFADRNLIACGIFYSWINFYFLANWLSSWQCYVNCKQPVIHLCQLLTVLSGVWAALYSCGWESPEKLGGFSSYVDGPFSCPSLVGPIEFPAFVVLLWVWRVRGHNEELSVYSRKPGQLRMGPDGSLLWGWRYLKEDYVSFHLLESLI